MEAESLNLAHFVDRTEVLGPGTRSAVWVQGCPFACEGCLAPGTRGEGGYWTDREALARKLLSVEDAEGVTISGGEPFLQAGPLARLVRQVRERRDYGVIVYSGFTLEELRGVPDGELLLEETDILIDGRYAAELDDGRPYRGSSNQRLLQLSGRYAEVFGAYYGASRGRRAEIRLGPGGTMMVGVPSKAALAAWKRLQSSGGLLKIADAPPE